MTVSMPASVPIPRAGLAEALGAGFSGGMQQTLQQKAQLAQALELEKQKQTLKQKGLTDLLGALGIGPSQTQMPSEGLPQQEQFSPEQMKTQTMTNLERLATNPGAMAALATYNPQAASQIQQMYKNQFAKEKFEFEKEKEARKSGLITPERREDLKNVFIRQLELLNEGNIGAFEIISALTPIGREHRSEFDTLSSSIEAALVPLVGKGTISKQRFNYILKNLPKSTDTKSKIIGKIKALSREFGITMPNFEITKEEVPQMEIGQGFETLPKTAPEGAIMRKGDKKYVFRNGKWGIK